MSKSALPALVFLLAGTLAAADAPPRFAGPFDAGLMAEPRNREASGLAPSRRAPDLVWTHNDSGGEPVLFALDSANGARRGAVRLAGIANEDWEDLASFELDGKAWVLVGDMGDNRSVRTQVVLHVVAEPDPAALKPDGELSVSPAYSIHFTYEDGPRDCESVAVDPRERAVFLLSKRDAIPRLYRLPLAAADRDHPAVARLVGTVPHLPQPEGWQKELRIPTGAYRGSPCAMAFSTNGTLAVVLTYGDLLLFPRAAGESWAGALAREPVRLPGHLMPQAEGVCFSADDRHLFVTSEQTIRWLRYDRR
jgi:hypothetical protein